MNKVLVDSSVWISFFKGTEESKILFPLLEANQICINDLILAELVPSLNHKRENEIAKLLQSIERAPLDIDWVDIMRMQTVNLKHGINKVGIPDLIIVQTAIQNNIRLLSLDRHFALMKGQFGFKMMDLR